MSRERPIRICRVQYENTPCSGADHYQRGAEYRQRVRVFGVIVGKKRAQSDLRKAAELR